MITATIIDLTLPDYLAYYDPDMLPVSLSRESTNQDILDQAKIDYWNSDVLTGERANGASIDAMADQALAMLFPVEIRQQIPFPDLPDDFEGYLYIQLRLTDEA